MSLLSERIQRHAKRFAGYAGAQVIVQLVNGITGLILVHALAKNEYAWLTIVNSLLATISVLSDSGLGSATTSLGGPLIGQPGRFRSLISTTRSLRHLFAVLSAALILPAGWWILQKNAATTGTIILLLLLTVASALPSAEAVVLTTVNRLYSKLRDLVVSDFVQAFARLFLIGIVWAVGATATLAAATTAGAIWIQTLFLRRQTRPLLTPLPLPSPEWRKPAMKVVGHFMPLCLFQCVQGHLTTWLLSVFATTSEVADVGALSRLSLLFTFLALPLANIVAPAIARCTEPRRLIRLCASTVLGYALAGVGMVLGGALFAPQILWLLGSKYAHLQSELVWYLGFQAIGLISTVMWGIVLTKGWVAQSWIHIPLTITLQVIAATQFDLGSIPHALMFSAIGSVTGILVCARQIYHGIKFSKKAAEHP